jgi:hypothetical protein
MDIMRGDVIRIPGGDGTHYATLMYWHSADGEMEGEPFGLMEHHAHQVTGMIHGGYVAWRKPQMLQDDYADNYPVIKHQLVSIEPLEISPSLLCAFTPEGGERCSSHGFIRAGCWHDA